MKKETGNESVVVEMRPQTICLNGAIIRRVVKGTKEDGEGYSWRDVSKTLKYQLQQQSVSGTGQFSHRP